MKITLFIISLVFITVNLSADKNWIPIEPADKAKSTQQNTQLDVDLSQVEPIKKIMKSVITIKQLMDKTKKEKENTADDKNWFELENGENK